MIVLANFAIFQVAWLSSVIGGAQEMPWLGPLAVLVAIAVHLRNARKPFEEIILLLSCAVIGAGFDSALVTSGWVSYKSGQFSAYIAPYWIITMWVLFGTTLNVSMRWMRGRPFVAAVFGLLGGPAAYLAGQKLGGIILVDQAMALIALGIGWAVIMPVLMRLSEVFDGMPGPRRKWSQERLS